MTYVESKNVVIVQILLFTETTFDFKSNTDNPHI